MKLKLNKKASIHIAIITIMFIFLFGYMLFAMYLSSIKISEDLNTFSTQLNLYAKEKTIENSLYLILAESFFNAYQKTLSENSRATAQELNKAFETTIQMGVYSRINKIKTKSTSDELFRKTLSEYKYNLSFDGKKATLKIPNWFATESSEKIKTNYQTNLSTSVSFQDFNLPSFDDILTAVDSCLENSASTFCVQEKFPNFILTDTTTIAEEYSFQFTSNEKFYIDNQMKQITFVLKFSATKP